MPHYNVKMMKCGACDDRINLRIEGELVAAELLLLYLTVWLEMVCRWMECDTDREKGS